MLTSCSECTEFKIVDFLLKFINQVLFATLHTCRVWKRNMQVGCNTWPGNKTKAYLLDINRVEWSYYEPKWNVKCNLNVLFRLDTSYCLFSPASASTILLKLSLASLTELKITELFQLLEQLCPREMFEETLTEICIYTNEFNTTDTQSTWIPMAREMQSSSRKKSSVESGKTVPLKTWKQDPP